MFVSPMLLAALGGGAAGMRSLHVCSEATPELGQPLAACSAWPETATMLCFPSRGSKPLLALRRTTQCRGPHLQLLTGLQTGQRSHKAAGMQGHLRQLPHRWSSRRWRASRWAQAIGQCVPTAQSPWISIGQSLFPEKFSTSSQCALKIVFHTFFSTYKYGRIETHVATGPVLCQDMLEYAVTVVVARVHV